MKAPSLPYRHSGLWILRIFVLVLLACLASVGQAKPQFLDLFLATYKPDPASALATARCGICHTKVPQKNPYGKDVKKLLDASSDGKLTVDMLRQLEPMDSDGDKWSNGDEIAAVVEFWKEQAAVEYVDEFLYSRK